MRVPISRSPILAAAIRDAYDRGITCVAAVGNDRGLIAAPASYPTTIGVGALGRFGTFPEDSGHALAVSNALDRRGGFFVARFSNFGLGVDCCAPGVGILSQVPGGYAAWDGTSMAGGLVCAAVALILEALPQLRTGDPSQPEAIRSILQQSSFDLGLPPYLQGAGMVSESSHRCTSRPTRAKPSGRRAVLQRLYARRLPP